MDKSNNKMKDIIIEVRKKKESLECELLKILREKFKIFEQETGLSIQKSEFLFLDCTTMENTKTKYLIADVNLKIEEI